MNYYQTLNTDSLQNYSILILIRCFFSFFLNIIRLLGGIVVFWFWEKMLVFVVLF